MSTFGLEESIEDELEGKAFALSYEYKTSNRNLAYEYDEFQVYHYAGGYDGNWTIDGPVIISPFTDQWQQVLFPLTSTRTWGKVGDKATIFIRPMVVTSNNNNIQGMNYHVRDIKIDVYE